MTDDELMHVYIRARNGESLGGLRAVEARARAEALEEAAQMVRNYCEQTKNMVARGCLASVAYDIRARAAEGGERG